MAEYRLTPAAEQDLEDIWQYTCTQWGADQAYRYTDKRVATFAELADSPKIAPACDHIRANYRRHSDEKGKFWLEPVGLARNRGITPYILRDIERLVYENREMLIGKYDEFHNR